MSLKELVHAYSHLPMDFSLEVVPLTASQVRCQSSVMQIIYYLERTLSNVSLMDNGITQWVLAEVSICLFVSLDKSESLPFIVPIVMCSGGYHDFHLATSTVKAQTIATPN